MSLPSPTQLRRRLLTRYAIRVAGADATTVRILLAELATTIDDAQRDVFMSILSHAHVQVHGPKAALDAIASLCRTQIKHLTEYRTSGAAIEPATLPKHVRPYPDPPAEPLALKVGLPQDPAMAASIWLDALQPEDLEAIAAWLRERKAKAGT